MQSCGPPLEMKSARLTSSWAVSRTSVVRRGGGETSSTPKTRRPAVASTRLVRRGHSLVPIGEVRAAMPRVFTIRARRK